METHMETHIKRKEARNEVLSAQITLERKNHPNQITDKEVDLICQRNFPDEDVIIDDIFQCLNRQASVEQLARIMERYAPVSDDCGNLWSAFYAGTTKEAGGEDEANKIIKAVELWGKKSVYNRYEDVMAFYCRIIDPSKLREINERSYNEGERSSWLFRPEQVTQMVISAHNLFKEGTKEDEESFHGYGFNDYLRATNDLLRHVYSSDVTTSPALATATAEFLQTQNQAKRTHVERDIEESMTTFKTYFPDYMPAKETKTVEKDDFSK